MQTKTRFNTLWEFYPYYLTEHAHPVCREFHFVGTLGFFILLVCAVILSQWSLLLLLPVCGYGFAWAGHFFFEKNKPATFTYPLYSLLSDFVMFYHILLDQLPKRLQAAQRSGRSEYMS